LGQRPGDRLAIDALLPQLTLECSLAAGTRPISRLDPGARERLVIEHAQFLEARDGALDEIRPVAGRVEPRSHFDDGPLPRLEEPQRGFEHDRRVADLLPILADLRERL